jgi:hypothetical protein
LSASPHPVTLVTQLSVDRLPQLAAQCASWSGRLSAVAYLAVPAAPSGDAVQQQEQGDDSSSESGSGAGGTPASGSAPAAPDGPKAPAGLNHWLQDQMGGAKKAALQLRYKGKGQAPVDSSFMGRLVGNLRQALRAGTIASRQGGARRKAIQVDRESQEWGGGPEAAQMVEDAIEVG